MVFDELCQTQEDMDVEAFNDDATLKACLIQVADRDDGLSLGGERIPLFSRDSERLDLYVMTDSGPQARNRHEAGCSP
jgi:hypothetical protein